MVDLPDSAPSDLLDDFSLIDARGGRRPNTVTCQVVRPLTAEDLPLLNDRSLSPSANFPSLSSIRTAHHQLAQLLARGMEQEQVALVTGYSPAYISRLKQDPAFKGLLQYYATQREQIQIDVLARMRDLGISTLEELQERLAADPSQFSNRELHEQLKLLLPVDVKGANPVGGASPSASGVTVNVNFVSSETPRPTLELQANSED